MSNNIEDFRKLSTGHTLVCLKKFNVLRVFFDAQIGMGSLWNVNECIYVGNFMVRLPKVHTKDPQRGPKVCLDTAFAVSTYDWQTMASRCVDAP